TVTSFSASTPKGALQWGLSWRLIACCSEACSAGPNLPAGVPRLSVRSPALAPSRKSAPMRLPPLRVVGLGRGAGAGVLRAVGEGRGEGRAVGVGAGRGVATGRGRGGGSGLATGSG